MPFPILLQAYVAPQVLYYLRASVAFRSSLTATQGEHGFSPAAYPPRYDYGIVASSGAGAWLVTGGPVCANFLI